MTAVEYFVLFKITYPVPGTRQVLLRAFRKRTFSTLTFTSSAADAWLLTYLVPGMHDTWQEIREIDWKWWRLCRRGAQESQWWWRAGLH